MILRTATVADASGVAALELELFDIDAWPLASVSAELSGADRFAVLALSGQELLGYAITMRGDDVVDVLRIGVAPAHRRRGTASALLGAALEQATSDGARRMLLEVSASNGPALAFYRSEGFVEIGRRPGYYRDGSAALVLCRRMGR